MNRKVLAISCLLISVIFVLPLSTVIAEKPTENNDVWFVAAVLGPATEMGKTWWTGEDTILHMKGRLRDWGVFRSPPGSPGAIMIGSMTTIIDTFVFNTETSEGCLILKVSISLTESDLELNPYGVGTLEGTMVIEVTSLAAVPSPGDGTGFVVATHGTGAFEDAKLTADLVMVTVAAGPMPGKYIFFGTHPNVNGVGTIVYH